MKLEQSPFETLFNFGTSIEGELQQTEFLYSFYIAKLKLLRKNNPEPYTTKGLADEEIFYKDMISACACYIQSLKIKKKENERNNQESGSLP